MADLAAAQAAFQAARDALNQASDDLVSAANEVASNPPVDEGPILAAVAQAAQVLAPFAPPGA